MANAALFIGWNRAITGRETHALELFYSANQYWAQQQTEGKIEGFEQILLNAHGGDLNGFTLVRGDRAKLNAIRETSEFQDLIVRAQHLLEGVGCIDAFVGQSVMEQAQRYAKVVTGK